MIVYVAFTPFVASATELQASEAAIREFVRTYVDAFNKQDLQAVSATWAEGGTHVDRETGDRTEGREAIRADLAEVFKDSVKTRLDAGTGALWSGQSRELVARASGATRKPEQWSNEVTARSFSPRAGQLKRLRLAKGRE